MGVDNFMKVEQTELKKESERKRGSSISVVLMILFIDSAGGDW